MKILHTTGDYKWTGPAEPMLHAIKALRERGHDVDLACPEPPPDQGSQLLGRARERGIDPVFLVQRRRGYWPLRDGGEVRRLRGCLRDGAYDLVHVHHTRDHLLGWLAARPLATRVVASWHHGDPLPRSPWGRVLLGPRGSAGLCVLSPRLAADARELGWPEERIAVIPGTVDTDRFAPREASSSLRTELGIQPHERVLGVVARLQPHRRFELLLEAFKRAREHAPGLRLLVLGRGTRARQVLTDPVRELELESAVIQAGYRKGDYLEALSLMEALIFLVPGSDGSCRALLEAMSMGKPGIVTERGVLPETVSDRQSGRVIPEDVDALTATLLDFWNEPARWQAYGKAARDYVLEHHTLIETAERLESFYSSLLP